MATQLPLSERTLEYLLPLSDWERTSDLLTGLAPSGYLDDSSAYSVEIATGAHLVWIAWRKGWTNGILAGRPGYEALDMLGHRVRSARSRAGTLEQWGSAVMDGLGVKLNVMSQSERMWWRRVYASAEGDALVADGMWDVIRTHEGTEQIIEAVGFIIDWHRQVRKTEAAS